MSRVAVTGASGFVGRATLDALARAGQEAVAVVRGEAPVGVRAVARIGGLDDAAGLRAAFAGADAVVHLAARVHVMRDTAADPLAAFRAVNVAGTRAVRDAARDAGVARLVLVSTVKVHGEGRDAPYAEDDAPAPQDAYGTSKLEAERLLQEDAGPPEWTIVRPPLVYGPGVGANFARLVRLADLSRRWPVPLGGLRNRRSLVYVGNLADALVRAATHPAAARRTYLVADDESPSTSELVALLARALGGRARLLPCPVGALRALGRLAGRAAEVDRLTGTLEVDASRIRRELGWAPPWSLAEGLAATVRGAA